MYHFRPLCVKNCGTCSYIIYNAMQFSTRNFPMKFLTKNLFRQKKKPPENALLGKQICTTVHQTNKTFQNQAKSLT